MGKCTSHRVDMFASMGVAAPSGAPTDPVDCRIPLNTGSIDRSRSRQPQRTLNQPAPTFVVPAFHKHAIEHERRLS